MFRYVAEDWHGNKADCRFLVSVKLSGNYIFPCTCLVLIIQINTVFVCRKSGSTQILYSLIIKHSYTNLKECNFNVYYYLKQAFLKRTVLSMKK